MKQFAPSPDLGQCSKTGSWEDPREKDACLSCVEYGNDYFYCGGVGCLSKYDSSTCSLNQFVAKNKEQCSAPCAQEEAPPAGGCSDKFDCPEGNKCMKKYDPMHGGMFGYCVPAEDYTPSSRSTYGI